MKKIFSFMLLFAAVAAVSCSKDDSGKEPEMGSNPVIGDFYMSDGSIVSKDAQLTAEQKTNCIGIVFQVDQARIGAGEKAALGGKAHGLVMALKNACSTSIKWGPQLDEGLAKCDTKAQCYNDISGYANSKTIRDNRGDFSAYEALKMADDYNTVCPAPASSTGWFMPSAGQWWDILQNLGGSTVHADSAQQQSPNGGYIAWKKLTDNIPANLNAWMSQFDKEQREIFVEPGYWLSTEYSASDARYFVFKADFAGIYPGTKNGPSTMKVRSILAF